MHSTNGHFLNSQDQVRKLNWKTKTKQKKEFLRWSVKFLRCGIELCEEHLRDFRWQEVGIKSVMSQIQRVLVAVDSWDTLIWWMQTRATTRNKFSSLCCDVEKRAGWTCHTQALMDLNNVWKRKWHRNRKQQRSCNVLRPAFTSVEFSCSKSYCNPSCCPSSVVSLRSEKYWI